MIKQELIKNHQLNYFGASVFLHLGLLLCLVFAFPQNTKTSLLPIGVEIVVDSAQHMPKVNKITTKESVMTDRSDVISEKKVSPLPVVTDVSENSNPVTSAASDLEGVKNGQAVSAEERFVYEIKKWFDRKKVYPQMAKAMGVSGTVLVEFTLSTSGEVLKAEVKKGAHPSLDQSALQLVKSIHGQKPFPQEITKTTWTMSVPIEFSLR